jgi:two-component system sensor histidine kinase QseC
MINSLRLRLVLLLFLAGGITLGAAVYFTHNAARQELDALFDAQLAESAHVLLGTARRELAERIEHGTDEMPVAHEYEQTLVYQIWDNHGLIVRSSAAPESALGDGIPGYTQAKVGGKPWRVLTRWDPQHEFMIVIAEPLAGREHLARLIALKMLFPTLAIIPMLALLTWLAVGTGLRPLRQLRREVVQRSADRLEPLAMKAVPSEVMPLVAALNDLFERLKQSIEAEKRFTADAAHELRTPLAALKTQAQVALRVTDSADRETALQHVLTGVDRATHLIEQLLTLARVDPEMASVHYQPVSLRQLTAEALGLIEPMAHQKHIELALEESDEAVINGDAGPLAILLRNLLDNAVRYTPTGGQVSVTVLHQKNEGVVLEVCDTGPGIPEEERARTLERFYRIPGTGVQGSGLGLSIVQRIAARHKARLLLHSGPHGVGLCVKVVFPEYRPG